MIMARRMMLEGAKVHAVTEVLPYPGGLTRNIVQCLQDFNIPLHLRHNVVEIYGRDRVEAVKIAKLDLNGDPTDEVFMIGCDTLLFSVGLIPENELSRMVPLDINPATGGPYVDDTYETTQDGVFICGNAAFVNDLADYVSFEGEVAGRGAADHVLDPLKKKRGVETISGENLRFIAPNFITREDKTTLYMRVKEPLLDVKITGTDGIVNVRKQIVKPGEMVEIELDREKLSRIKTLKEFRIDVRPSGQ